MDELIDKETILAHYYVAEFNVSGKKSRHLIPNGRQPTLGNAVGFLKPSVHFVCYDCKIGVLATACPRCGSTLKHRGVRPEQIGTKTIVCDFGGWELLKPDGDPVDQLYFDDLKATEQRQSKVLNSVMNLV